MMLPVRQTAPSTFRLAVGLLYEESCRGQPLRKLLQPQLSLLQDNSSQQSATQTQRALFLAVGDAAFERFHRSYAVSDVTPEPLIEQLAEGIRAYHAAEVLQTEYGMNKIAHVPLHVLDDVFKKL